LADKYYFKSMLCAHRLSAISGRISLTLKLTI
jgi:hypothetical protein